MSCTAAGEIRASFRCLAKQLHPDVSADPQDTARLGRPSLWSCKLVSGITSPLAARFMRISEAYDVLSDEVKRREYNREYDCSQGRAYDLSGYFEYDRDKSRGTSSKTRESEKDDVPASPVRTREFHIFLVSPMLALEIASREQVGQGPLPRHGLLPPWQLKRIDIPVTGQMRVPREANRREASRVSDRHLPPPPPSPSPPLPPPPPPAF